VFARRTTGGIVVPPKVSVVTLCFGDRAAFLRERVDSILSQTYRDFEWILVDDGTPSNTKSILRELASEPRVSIIAHPQPRTISESYNEAIARCKGDYVLRAEDDDTAKPALIEKLVDVLERYPRVGIAFCAARRIDEAGRDLGPMEAPTLKGMGRSNWLRPGVEVFLETVLDGCYVFGCSQMLRRSCLLELGTYSPDLAGSADADLVNRIAVKYDIGYVAEPLVGYRTHLSSYTHRKPHPSRVHEYYVVYERAMEYARRSGLRLDEGWKSDVLKFRAVLVWQSVKESIRTLEFGLCAELLRAASRHDPHLIRNMARGLVWRFTRPRSATEEVK
jgi:glycosyltransferase involved in cell wall biosynthesis